MAPAAVPDTLPCESGAVFAREALDAKDILSLEETEESWEHIRRSVCRLHALYKGGGWQFEQDVVISLKTLLRPIINAMNSDRSKLSFEAVDFVASLASLGRAFDPLLNHIFDALLKLCLKTSRILVARAQTAITRVVEETTLPGILPHLREAVKDKNQNLRVVASDAVLLAMNTFAPRDLNGRVTDVEEIIRSTGRDANPGVRQTSRKIFEAYQILFPERVDNFTAPLTPIMKKYLAVKPRAAALNKSVKAVPFNAAAHDAHVPTSAPSGRTEFPSSSSHTRSASASEPHHTRPQAQREPAPARPILRTQRSRPAMRADILPPVAPAPAAEHTAQSFQPTRSAPAPGAQRQRTVSALSAKSAMSALGVVSASGHQPVERRGPQRVLSTDLPPAAVSAPEHPRVVSGPSRVQRPATAMGTISSSSSSGSMGPPAPVVVHRAQRVLVPAPPPPPPSAPEKPVERAPSRQDKERPTHSRTGSGSRSNPPTRPASAASMASRAKPAVPSRPPTAASTRSIITTTKPPLSRSATASRPPLSKSATSAPHSKSVAAPPRKHVDAAKTSKIAAPAERTGFVPKRNREATGAGGATQMTASALARAKELREARERVAAAKVKASKKPGPAPPKKPAKPIEVPLPPSPGCPPREVPLPASPEPLDLSPAESESKPESHGKETRPESRGKENLPEQHKLEVAALVAKLVPLALEEQAADSFGPLDVDEDELAGVEFAHGHAFDPHGEVVHTVARERTVFGAVNAQ